MIERGTRLGQTTSTPFKGTKDDTLAPRSRRSLWLSSVELVLSIATRYLSRILVALVTVTLKDQPQSTS